MKKDKLYVPKRHPYRYKSVKKFQFGTTAVKIGNIYIKRKYNNIFITLTDLFHKVICCKSAGVCVQTKNKRRKRIAFTVKLMVELLVFYLKKYNIKCLNVITFIRMRGKGYLKKLIRTLKESKIKIKTIVCKRVIAHNGVRGKNLRRL